MFSDSSDENYKPPTPTYRVKKNMTFCDSSESSGDLYKPPSTRGRSVGKKELGYETDKEDLYSRIKVRSRQPNRRRKRHEVSASPLPGRKRLHIRRISSDESTDENGDGQRRKKRRVSASQCLNQSIDQDGTRFNPMFEPVKPDLSVRFDSVGGLDQQINKIREAVLYPIVHKIFYEIYNIKPPKGIIFHGPPGTGKTLMARAIASEAYSVNGCQVPFFMLKGSEILSKWVGESEKAVRCLFESARKTERSIVFIDEIDGIATSRSLKTDQSHNSLVSTLLMEMDGLRDSGKVIVIAATNRIEMVDPALRRPGRFDYELQFKLPNHKARLAILKILTGTWPEKPSNQNLEDLSSRTTGYTGADLKLLCNQACLIALKRCFPQNHNATEKCSIDYHSVKVKNEDFIKALREIPPSGARLVGSGSIVGGSA